MRTKHLPLSMLLLILFALPVFSIPLPSGFTGLPSGRVVLAVSKDSLPGIVEEPLDTLSDVIPTVAMTSEEVQAYSGNDLGLRAQVAEKLEHIDLDLHYFLLQTASVQTGPSGKLNVYREPDTRCGAAGYLQLPAYVTVIKKRDNFIKIRLLGDRAAWVNTHEFNSAELEARLLKDMAAASCQVEAGANVQRCYYQNSFGDRLLWGGAGVLGSVLLLADGISKTGLAGFSGTSMASIAQGAGTLLGAVEVLGGAYIGWNSIAYLATPQEKFIYREWDGKTSLSDAELSITPTEDVNVPVVSNELLQIMNGFNVRDEFIRSYSAELETIYRDPVTREQGSASTMSVAYTGTSGFTTSTRTADTLIPANISDIIKLSEKLRYSAMEKNGDTVILATPRGKKGTYSRKKISRIEYVVDPNAFLIKKLSIYGRDNTLQATLEYSYQTVSGVPFPDLVRGSVFWPQGSVAFETKYSNIIIN